MRESADQKGNSSRKAAFFPADSGGQGWQEGRGMSWLTFVMRHGIEEAEHEQCVVVIVRAVQGMVHHVQEGSGKEEGTS